MLAFFIQMAVDPWSHPTTVQAIIVTLGVITTAMSGVAVALIARTRTHAKAAVDQVRNSHDSNLRDDLDEKFKAVTDGLKEVSKDLGGMKSDIRQIRKEASEDRTALAKEQERIRELETTLPRLTKD